MDRAIAKAKSQFAGHHRFGLPGGDHAVVGMDQIEDRPAGHVVGRVAEDALETGIDEQEVAVDIDDIHSVGHQVEHVGKRE